ncbi:MAG: 1-deoxy-D-xylulose-5-phosphate reductoisomerase [Candidatus Omnitrophica bacterium]|nr:1-deoxy-D-xylulose-5-phosphate reductoisomerase [Candidatus Omnitrophota bacterium]
MKNIVILGSTGTIGQNTLEVIRKGRDRFNVIGLACRENKDLLARQIREFRPEYVYFEKVDTVFERRFPRVKILCGDKGLEKIASLKKADIIICAIPGISTLKAVCSAIRSKKVIGLATKEILVVAGHIINRLSRKYGACILPVDSEHNAVFQALEGIKKEDVKKIYLTASGGPFGGRPAGKNATLKDVLKHPVWKMGKKITVDSATMMNKAFEIIEAHYLFGLPAEKIGVLIHPEAFIHGMVELNDGTIKGVFSSPDMKFPINFVLDYPRRKETPWRPIDFSSMKKLTFSSADRNSAWFSLAAEAIEKNGSLPVVLNAANEEAVNLFLQGKIKFNGIIDIVQKAVRSHRIKKHVSLEDIFEIDRRAKNKVRELVRTKL